MRLEGKVAIITGAGAPYGIGQATAILFSKEGAKIIIADVNEKEGRETEKRIREAGSESTYVPLDVRNQKDVKNMVNKTIDTYGKIDILVNNAGINIVKPFNEMTEEDWDLVNDIACKGTFLCCKYVIPEMLKNGSGAIVNITSTAAVQPLGGMCAYNAAKAGVSSITKTLALEYSDQNIRINAVMPGMTETRPIKDLFPEVKEKFVSLHPIGRFASPEETAKAILFLASDESSFCTGSILAVDGGFSAGISKKTTPYPL